MADQYENLSLFYDDLGVSNYSVSFGKNIFQFLKHQHPDFDFKKCLDIGCGTGELCNFFKENGIEAKGVDISENMVDVARGKFPDIDFIVEDASKYHPDEKFDIVTSFNDALNHIIDDDSIKSTIENISNCLRDDGFFIFDINNFGIFSTEKYTYNVVENKRFTHHFKRNGNMVTIDLEYFEDDELVWKGIVMERDYSIEEMAKLLNDAGLIIEVCAQYFYEDHFLKKWKIVSRKIQ